MLLLVCFLSKSIGGEAWQPASINQSVIPYNRQKGVVPMVSNLALRYDIQNALYSHLECCRFRRLCIENDEYDVRKIPSNLMLLY